jgi:hypothetical protein
MEYVHCAPDIALIRDLLGGTRTMHAKYKDYIPKYKAEKPDAYKRRATSAKVFGGLGRTLSASVGMLFAKPPKREDRWTPELEGHAENIDGKGTKLEVYAKRRSEDAIADGFVGILVDFPSVPEGVTVTAKTEQELNLRPKWASYARADILSWDTAVIDNVETLVQVVLREGATKKTGRFSVEHFVLYRVCFLSSRKEEGKDPVLAAGWDLIEEKVQSDGSVVLVSHGSGVFRDKAGTPFDRIPLAVVYAGRTDAMFCARPPLLDVAWANLEHWRTATNLKFYEDMCAFPQPTLKGDLAKGANGEERPFMLGPGVLVQTTSEGEFSFAELQGTSLDQLRQSLAEKKKEIGELGLSFLAGDKPAGVESADKARLDATAENSTLATAAQATEDGFNQALMFHAKYMGIPAEQAPVLTINREFEEQIMDPAVMGAYAAFLAQGMPKDAIVRQLIAGGRLPADTDVEAFVTRWDAAEQAAKDLADMEQQAQLDRMRSTQDRAA